MWYYYKEDQATAFHTAVDKAVEFLTPLKINAIVFRGFSGAEWLLFGSKSDRRTAAVR